MMKFVALISGGKDSIYSLCKLISEGHTLQALLHVKSNIKTIDSFMFQTVGTEIIDCYEKCLNVPLFTIDTNCLSINTSLEYSKTENDEVEDLYNGLSKLKSKIDFDSISSGAILSNYQKNRLENICKRLNISTLSPLYGLDQKKLLNEMITYGIDARIVKVAGGGLTKDTINEDLKYVMDIYNNSKYIDVNYCGEGGEYETIVVDCPIFKFKIIFEGIEILRHEDENFENEREDAVYYMKIKKWKIIDKNNE